MHRVVEARRQAHEPPQNYVIGIGVCVCLWYSSVGSKGNNSLFIRKLGKGVVKETKKRYPKVATGRSFVS